MRMRLSRLLPGGPAPFEVSNDCSGFVLHAERVLGVVLTLEVSPGALLHCEWVVGLARRPWTANGFAAASAIRREVSVHRNRGRQYAETPPPSCSISNGLCASLIGFCAAKNTDLSHTISATSAYVFAAITFPATRSIAPWSLTHPPCSA
jgi:hypothetical protein